MKMLWRLSREAIRYRSLYVIAILSTPGLTAVNLAAPKALSAMTGILTETSILCKIIRILKVYSKPMNGRGYHVFDSGSKQ